MKRLLFLLSIISFCFLSCDKEEDIQGPPVVVDPDIQGPPVVVDQTVFMYLPWSVDLTSFFYTNIADMKTAIKKRGLDKERVLVFFHHNSKEATLFELKVKKGECIVDTLKYYYDPPFTTPEGVTSILSDVKTNAPANRYGMIIGCHGMGWVPVATSSQSQVKGHMEREKEYWEHEGPVKTRWFGGTSPQYQTDITTLAKGISDAGMKMEYILFDDCYMSSIEVAYDLKEVTDYVVASPCEIMAYGMPYAEMGQYLIGKVDYAAVSNSFLTFYQNYSTPCGTIGVTVCNELEKLAAIMKRINERYTFDNSWAMTSIQRMDGYSPVRFYDYGDYVAKLCTDPNLLEEFQQQLKRTVPPAYSLHTDYFYTMSRGKIKIDAYTGVTTSDPSTSSYVSVKTETSWYKATH